MDTKKDISSIAMYCNKNKKKLRLKHRRHSDVIGGNRRYTTLQKCLENQLSNTVNLAKLSKYFRK